MKKFLLSLFMLIPWIAWADDSGTTGNCTWYFEEATGTLTISGNGDGVTEDYYYGLNQPWRDYFPLIKKVVVEDGVIDVGECVLVEMPELLTVELAKTVYVVSGWGNEGNGWYERTFSGCGKLQTVYVNGFLTQNLETCLPEGATIVYGPNGGVIGSPYSDYEMLNTDEDYINKRYLREHNNMVTVPVYIKLKNADICQMQFTIYTDKPFKIARDENDELMLDLDKTRFNYTSKKGYSHSVTITERLDDDPYWNRYYVVISSSSNAAISGEDGLLFNVTFDYEGELEDRGYKIMDLRDLEMANTKAEAYHPVGFEKFVQVNRRDPGDADGDGEVTVSDFANVVNLIANISDLDDASRKASDVNGDGNVTVTDLAGIVNIILYGNWQGEQAAGAKSRDNGWATYDNNTTVSIEPFSITPGETKEVEVNLYSLYNDLSQAQFDLVLPKGLSVVGMNGEPDIMPGELVASGKRGFSHTIASAQREDGTVRVLCLSDNNTPFISNNGNIVRITVQADENLSGENCDLALSNIKLSRTDASKVNVAGVKANVKVKDSTTDINSIGNNGTQHVDIYRIDGVRTGKLNRGINIIRTSDGKTHKVFVK